MAKQIQYVVVHPIRHGKKGELGRGYNRGEVIPAGKFTDEEAAELLGRGVIAVDTTANPVVAELLAASTLEKFNLVELCSYATGRGVVLREGLSKAEILSEISQSATAGVQLADAEALAAAQGR